MATLYEGMFLIDNDAVRAGWDQAKAVVTDLLAKHGGTVRTARRWDERRLRYTIKRRNRATYLLAYYELPADSIATFLRDLELNESVLRYLQLRVPALPEGELELSQAESADDYVVPEPPADDAVDEPEPSEDGEGDEGATEGAAAEGAEKPAETSESAESAESAETPAEPVAETVEAETPSTETEPALASADTDEAKEG
jgi:ribosomal protein S6